MDELIKQLATMGVGGLIAAILLYYTRKDREDLKSIVERLFTVIDRNTETSTHLADLVKGLHDHLIYQEKLHDRRNESRVN
jgi:hypothetical protein